MTIGEKDSHMPQHVQRRIGIHLENNSYYHIWAEIFINLEVLFHKKCSMVQIKKVRNIPLVKGQ